MYDPTVFIVDNNPGIRQSLRKMTESAPFVVETYQSANEFLNQYSIYRVGCLLLDVNLPGMTGLDLQKELNRCKYRLPIIFMSGEGSIPTAVDAIKNGAMDFLEKPLNPHQTLRLLKTALLMDEKRRGLRLRYDAIRARVANLTPRESEVLVLVVHQNTNKSIASHLGVSIKTVEFHRSRVMQKMHAHSLLELAEMVRENNTQEDYLAVAH